MLLEAADIDYIPQKQIGGKVVDFYSPSLNIAFEADGAYWHQDKAAEQARDKYLAARGVSYVLHFNEDELTFWKIKGK